MLTGERDRLELFRALERVIGADPARTLMDQLPPRPWDQLATRDDLSKGMEFLEHRLVAEFRAQIIAQNRLLFFSMTGAILTAASLAFAAVRF
ncbi:MAG: hypothetical protein ACLFUG_12200 [Nitriliruptoraceae bacterium]